MKHAQDVDPVRAELVEDGVWQPTQQNPPNAFVAPDHWSALRKRLEALEQPIHLFGELIAEPRSHLFVVLTRCAKILDCGPTNEQSQPRRQISSRTAFQGRPESGSRWRSAR